MSSDNRDQLKPANISHDLRTPLNHIIGYSELLIEDAEDAHQSAVVSALQQIRAHGKQLLARVNDIFSPLKSDPAGPRLSQAQPELSTFTQQIRVQCAALQEAGDTRFNADLNKIATAAANFDQLVEKFRAALNTAPDPPAPSRSRRPRPITSGSLLIVDDNAENRDILTLLLERQGYTVASAINGQQALSMAEQEPFDLILLDMVMPDMDGYAVLQHLKSSETLRTIPVIVVSALDDLDRTVHCIELGAEDYLGKPFDPVLLHARIEASLEKKRLRDQELIYLQQVELLTYAAQSLENDTFEPESLIEVAARTDALGHLARVFLHMAHEVYEREARLKTLTHNLDVDIDRVRQNELINTVTSSDYFKMLRQKIRRPAPYVS